MKNKQKLSADNGVSLSYRVEANERIRVPFFNEIMLCLLSIIACVGAIMTFATVLNFQVETGVVISFIVIFSAIFAVLYKVIKKHSYLVIVGAAVVAGIVALIFLGDFLKGVEIIFDQSRITISEFMGWDEPTVAFPWQDDFVSLTSFAIILLSLVLGSAISYFTFVKQSFIAIFLLTFPFFEVGAIFGAVPNYLYFSIMIASWAAYLTTSRVSNSKIKMRRSNGKKQKKEIDGSRQKFAGIAVVIAMVVVLVFTGITSYLNTIDFTRAENIDNIRRETKYAFEDFIDLISGVDNDGSLKEGKLNQLKDRIVKNRHYITMQTNIPSVKEPIKIKGYTATTYKNNQWNQIENFDDYSELFESFNDRSYMMGVNTGKLVANYGIINDVDFADITMSDFRRKKAYAYEVYYADFDTSYTPIYDTSVAPKSEKSYTYTAYLSAQYIYNGPLSEYYKDEAYKQAFSKYADFVNKEYIGSEAADSVKDLAASFQAKDKFEYINLVRIYLRDNIKLTNKAGKCPSGVDFVENFLFNTKKGYSSHFASAAAVLMQAKGYPARYVEGYYIPANDFNKTPSEHRLGYKTFDITDKYAHAWIEIFDSTYGWIPVEVTPGYWSDDISPSAPSTPPESDKVDEESPEKQPENIVVMTPDLQIKDEINIVEDEVKNKLGGWQDDAKILLQILIVILSLALVAAIAIYISYLIRSAIKRKICSSDDVNKKLKFTYKYLFRLTAYQKIKIDNVYDYMSLADYVGEKAYYISADKLKYIFGVLLKHAYSPAPANNEEADEIIAMLNDYSNAIYYDLSKYEKLVYKYVRSLL